MVNHEGEKHLNCVHSYNRVLNDVFEDDEINVVHQREAAIDVRFDDEAETFIVFHAGPQSVDGEIEAELTLPNGGKRSATKTIKVPKLCHQVLKLTDIFTDLKKPLNNGVLKVLQPSQFQFYGRMLVGQIDKTGAISANHSYYDSSSIEEYWEDNRPSTRIYPFFKNYDNILKFYPIMSPGELKFSVNYFNESGNLIGTTDAGVVSSLIGTDISFSVNNGAKTTGVDLSDITTFEVEARPLAGNTPTRVNHQIAYSSGKLESSVNISLVNPNIFVPEHKTSYSWGQTPVGEAISTSLGLSFTTRGRAADDVQLEFYSPEGRIHERTIRMEDGGGCVIDLESVVGDLAGAERPQYVWFSAKAKRPDLSAMIVTKHVHGDHVCGEHSF